MSIPKHFDLFTKSKFRKEFFVLTLAVLVVTEITAIAYLSTEFPPPASATELQVEAGRILKKCANETYRLVCYNNEIPKLLSKISLQDAFRVTEIIQGEDSTLGNCHVVAHKLVRDALGGDSEEWKDAITQCPANACQNGCLHGVMEAGFKNKRLGDEELNSLPKELSQVCEPGGNLRFTLAQKSFCYHGLGHLFMYATAADLKKATSLCSTITNGLDKDLLTTCLAGTFMQVYRFVDEEDRELVKNITPKNKEEVDKLCGQFTNPKYFEACYLQSWPITLKEPLKPDNLISFCSFTSNDDTLKYCYRSIINQLAERFVFHEKRVDKINDYCNGLIGKWRGLCYEFASTHLVHIDPKYAETAVSICNQAPSQYQNSCFETLTRLSSSNFKPKSSELTKFCNTLPTPWREKCLT